MSLRIVDSTLGRVLILSAVALAAPPYGARASGSRSPFGGRSLQRTFREESSVER
jgi:hypothetical protein